MPQLSLKMYSLRKAAALRIPLSGSFELTPRCNFNCRMCYIHMSAEEQAAAGRELSTAEWIELGDQAVKSGMIYLLLTGGEPLLRPDFLEIYTSILKKGVIMSVNTNGSLITEEIVDCWRRHRPENVNITLYGMSDETYGNVCRIPGGFERAMRGIMMLKEAGIRMCLNCTFIRDNVGDMEKIVEFSKKNGVPVRMASYTFPPVRAGHGNEVDDSTLGPCEIGEAAAKFDKLTLTPQDYAGRCDYISRCVAGEDVSKYPGSRLLPESRISSCMAGRSSFWVTWDGKLLPCGMLPTNSREINGDFASAWKATTEAIDKVLLPVECLKCEYQAFCPTCAAVGECANGATDKVARQMCDRTKKYVEVLLNKEK
ncbi:MAG: radical SAM protein [Clostridia bacterium]|nr:radical SAM protein [Clostridia bacterium]